MDTLSPQERKSVRFISIDMWTAKNQKGRFRNPKRPSSRDKANPHTRSREEELASIWLDRGLDIYRFEGFEKPTFQTLESCAVIEVLTNDRRTGQ
jgi:hypothetical protein